MKILGPNDSGKGILVEWDAGIINPNEHRNSQGKLPPHHT